MSAQKSKKHGGVVNTVIYILLLPLYLICKIYPKNKRLYAFGSSHGMNFADNAKYLFLYAHQNMKDIKVVFLSRNQEVIKLLRKSNYPAHYTFSWQGIKTAVRAHKCFISHSTHDIHSLLIGGAEIIQLWHGTPLKKIAYDVPRATLDAGSPVKRILRKLVFTLIPYLNTSDNFDRIVVSSESIRENYRTAFRIDDSKIAVLGQPRNDTMHHQYEFNRNIFPELEYLEKLRQRYRNTIVWMPTHRLISGGGVADLIDGYEFNFKKLENFLKSTDSCLVIKGHFLDASDLKKKLEFTEPLVLYPHADPYPLLKYTDVLITDYSSVYFDYLLLNRPIVFAPFDYDTYMKNDASFYYDYDQVTPGPKCNDWNELIAELENLIRKKSDAAADPYLKEREKVNRLFNDYADGNCRRVVDKLF